MGKVQLEKNKSLRAGYTTDEWIEHGRRLQSAEVFTWFVKAVGVFRGKPITIAEKSQEPNLECFR